MNCRKLISAVLWPIISTIAFLAPAQAGQQPAQQPREWGEPLDGVQIALYLASPKPTPSGLPAIDLAMRNLGPFSKKISLGGGCGPVTPGWKTDSVILIAIDMLSRSQTLEDLPGPPLLAGCGGVIGVFAVDVKPGETISVPIDLDCYYVTVRSNKLGHYVLDWGRTANALHYAWARGGTYSLRAELGNLKSNDLSVLFSSNVPSRRCFQNGLVVPCADSK